MEKYKFSQLTYVPNDYEAIQKKIDDLTEQVKSAASPEEIIKLIESYDVIFADCSFMASIAMDRFYINSADQSCAEAFQKETEGSAMLNSTDFFKALRETPFLPQLEAHYGSEFTPRLEKEFRLNAEGRELIAQEQSLINQYQQKKAMLKINYNGKENSESEMYVHYESPDRQARIDSRKAVAEAFLAQKEEFSSILLRLIELRDKIAKANGFHNYLEYSNARYDRRGYGEAEMTAFCEQVKTDLVPLLRELHEEQRKELGLDKLMTYDSWVMFADGNAKPAGDAAYLTEASKKMYDSLSPEFGKFFRSMVDTESFDITSSPNKVAGMGYCQSLLKRGYYPFIFGNCNGTEGDVAVFTHEMGHAWQMYLSSQQNYITLYDSMALDAVEIPSKTMELFTYPYAEHFFGKDADKFRKGNFRNALNEIAGYCSIHEFNTYAYTHVGASFEELVSVMRSIQKAYDPDIDYGELDSYNAQGSDLLRSMAVYSFPRYVISYALSEMCAMDFFSRMKTDPKAAWDSYIKLCTSGGSRSYPDTLAQAGLQPAYKEGSVKKVVDFARTVLKTL